MTDVPFGFAKPDDSPGFLLWQVAITWQRFIKQTLEKQQLSHAQFVIMALLLWFETQSSEVNQCTIVRWSRLDKMTVSQTLKKLTKDGLVNRKTCEKDTRAKSISLTSLGKRLIHRIIPKVEATDTIFFEALTHQELQQCKTLLKKLACASANEAALS